MPAVEEYGVEPIPAELRTVGWRDLFAINFTFFLNPVMYVLGALAVVDGGLPLWWAVAAMVAGQALAFAPAHRRRAARRRLRAHRARSRCARTSATGARACCSSPYRVDRGDVLVRGAGADGAGSDARRSTRR